MNNNESFCLYVAIAATTCGIHYRLKAQSCIDIVPAVYAGLLWPVTIWFYLGVFIADTIKDRITK